MRRSSVVGRVGIGNLLVKNNSRIWSARGDRCAGVALRGICVSGSCRRSTVCHVVTAEDIGQDLSRRHDSLLLRCKKPFRAMVIRALPHSARHRGAMDLTSFHAFVLAFGRHNGQGLCRAVQHRKPSQAPVLGRASWKPSPCEDFPWCRAC